MKEKYIHVLNKFMQEDWFLVMGLVLVTMTKLRIASVPIGPGEICLTVWVVLKIIFRKKNKEKVPRIKMIALHFWIIMAITMAIGVLVNCIAFQYSNNFHNVLAYFFCFIVTYTVCRYMTIWELQEVICRVVVVGTLIITFVYIISAIGFFKEFAFWSGVRFTGGAKNPNQLAILLACFPFISFQRVLFFKKKKLLYAVLWMLILIATVFLGVQTKSDALIAAWIVALAALIYLEVEKRCGKNNKRIVRFLFVIVLVTLILIMHETIISQLSEVFAKLDEDGSRAELWVSGLRVSLKSFFLGLGPGSFAGASHVAEAHNTYLDFITQGGIILGGYLICILIVIFKGILRKPIESAGLVAIVMLAVGHFVGRHPVFYVLLVYYFFLSKNNTENREKFNLK